MINRQKLSLFSFIVIISVLGAFLFLGSLEKKYRAQAAGKPTPQALQSIGPIEQAVLEELNRRKGNMPIASMYSTRVDRVKITSDGDWASTWLVPNDPRTGVDLETEPGLAILKSNGESWDVALPGDAQWDLWLETAPADLLPSGEKEQWLSLSAESQVAMPSGPLSGYRLPWEGGVRGGMTGSLTHDGYLSCNSHYAFDFIITDPSTGRGGLFPIRAARSGTVWRYYDETPTNDSSWPNYIVLKDISNGTYQLYLHLDHNSIPPEFRVIGKAVSQGDVIGIADDTGLSTGHHLHFMVHTNPDSYWGRSVDITFDDVAINGGRPRMRWVPGDPNYDDFMYCNNRPNSTEPSCAATLGTPDICNNYQNFYISGNVEGDHTPPIGGLWSPVNKSVVNAGQVDVIGWAQDAASGLESAQVRAYYNGAWNDVGAAYAVSPFSFTWDFCQAKVPDGPVTVNLRLIDKEKNTANLDGLVTFIKNYNCPNPVPPLQPVCQPSDNQVAVFTQENYQGGCDPTKNIFDIGTYSNGEISTRIGEDTGASILVGANVRATLFNGQNLSGRSETVDKNDSNLGDNRTGSRTLSSMIVQLKTVVPASPQLVWPSANGVITQTYSLNLYWRDMGGASEFQARLARSTQVFTSTWQVDPFWNLGTGIEGVELLDGNYTWQVRGRNSAGTSAWSVSQAFTILPFVPGARLIQAPFTEDFEAGKGGWTGSGYWHYIDHKPLDNPTHSWWFGDFDGDYGHQYFYRKSGDLTSPEFLLPASGTYSLRFKYRAQTESSNRFWDQRWVQIKVGDGPFQNLYQITDDIRIPYTQPDTFWLSSPVFDLSAYQGQRISIRFHFDTIDPSFKSPDNDYEGWYIDEVSVNSTPPPACVSIDEPNNSYQQAIPVNLAPGDPVLAELCPAGDIDYFKITAQRGDRLSANLDRLIQSNLDAHLTLLDTDGSSILATNDDEKFPDLIDPFLVNIIPRDGTYYLKVKAWDHPSAGSPDFLYTLRLAVDNIDPTAQMIFPLNASVVNPDTPIKIQSSDGLSGVDRVEIYLHDGNWANPAWNFLGYGSLVNGLWTFSFAPPDSQTGIAILGLVFDKAGQVTPVIAWDITLFKSNFPLWLPLVSK